MSGRRCRWVQGAPAAAQTNRTAPPRWAWFVVGMIAVSALAWPWAPARMAIHWDPTGDADGYGSPAVALLFLPVVSTAMGLVMAALPSMDPRVRSTPASSQAYDRMTLGLLALLGAVHVAVAFQLDVPRLIAPALGAMLAWLGRCMVDLEPNGLSGVRLPWTLTSRRSWDAAHRAMRTDWYAVGALVGVIGAIWPSMFIFALLPTLTLSIVHVMWVARRTWRDDPDHDKSA